MTMDTANKWAAGIADTYALGLAVIALPDWSTAPDGHPAT
nr:hypothetical protein [Streptomyces sp. I05A-00742]